MALSFTDLLDEIKEVFLFFLDYVFGSIFDGCLTEPTLIMQIFLFSFCTMSCLGLLIDFLIDHNHLFSEYMKDSADFYVKDRKQREKEAEREAKNEEKRIKHLNETFERRAKEWRERHPNANVDGERYSKAYFKEHPQSVSFNYDGVTYYNNEYLEKLVRKEYPKRSYDLDAWIKQKQAESIDYEYVLSKYGHKKNKKE